MLISIKHYIIKCFSLISLLLLISNSSPQKSIDYLSYVNPYIGSSGHGHVFVGVSVPFGAVQVGPHNIIKGWDWCSGYHYSDSVIIGFSHTRISGSGCGDMGDILIMPFSGEIRTKRGEQHDISNSCASYYKKNKEKVAPNFYSLAMENGILAEITSTERVAMHRFTYPINESSNLLINLKEGVGDRSIDTELRLIDEYTIQGHRISSGWGPEHSVYFTLISQQPIDKLLVYNDDEFVGENHLKGPGVKGVIVFKQPLTNGLFKVGISSVSAKNALKNIQHEITHWDFDRVKSEAAQKWNNELSKIEIITDDNAKKTIFYTAMYHSFIAPGLYCDVNGEFRGHDKKVYSKTHNNYSTFSLWDTYRAIHPLFTIIQRDKVSDFVNSMLNIFDQQDKLPIWALPGAETNQMPGYSAVPVIADAVVKGIDGIDSERAFNACKVSAMNPKQLGIPVLIKNEFIPAGAVAEETSVALEYAVGDWAIAAMAGKLNKNSDTKYFLKRSNYYKHYFDTEINHMRPKNADGSWLSPYNPFTSVHGHKANFCEGNGWQYTFFAPHDAKGLIDLMGGDENFIQKLDSFFIAKGDLGLFASPDISGLIGQYAHGNEPSHHIAYLYSYAGQQWKSAEKIRYIMENFYTDKPDGIIGNEDCGQMSAWYILSAIGMYQVNPSAGLYVFGSPLFDKVQINLADHKSFVIVAENNSKDNIYIQSVKFNGLAYEKVYISYSDIIKGGSLVFKMGNKPNRKYGAKLVSRPKSKI